jgi:hypothetical protein
MKLVLPHPLNDEHNDVVKQELDDGWEIECASGDGYWQAVRDADATFVLA